MWFTFTHKNNYHWYIDDKNTPRLIVVDKVDLDFGKYENIIILDINNDVTIKVIVVIKLFHV